MAPKKIGAWLRLAFWVLIAKASYALHKRGLPSGYGHVSAKHMRAWADIVAGVSRIHKGDVGR